MSIRRLIVEVDPKTLNVTRFCAEHGVSTWFFWNLRKRYAAHGDAALAPRSRAPHRVANKTPAAIEDAVVAQRKWLLEQGLDAGHESIWSWLEGLDGLPSPSTIYRILVDRGCITPTPSKAPKRACRSFTAERANECWQIDDTPWLLADGSEVKILNVIDDHSRLLVTSFALEACTGAAALAAVADAAAVLGWPTRFLSDNARAFRHTLASALAQLGVAAGHSRPYHPQTNGKVERFHQTLKQRLARQPQATTLAELQAQLDAFRHIYNHQRPHRSLGRRRPAEVWTAAPKSGPANRPLGTTTIHRSTVIGGVTGVGRRYVVSLGAAHNGHSTLTVVTGTACHVFIDGQLVRQLTLDPTRRVQPLYTRPGRPRLP